MVSLHPAYSPDLALTSYAPSPHLKKELAGEKFETDEECEKYVDTIFKNLDADFYNDSNGKLIIKCNKC